MNMITKNKYDYKKSAAASRLTLPLGWDGHSRMITRMMVTVDDRDDDGGQGGRSCAKAQRAFAEKFGLGRKF